MRMEQVPHSGAVLFPADAEDRSQLSMPGESIANDLQGGKWH